MLFLLLNISAQNPTHTNLYKNVEFAQKTDFKGDSVFLRMDIYTPAEKYNPTPILLFFHGGGFAFGDKTAPASSSICNTLSQYGIACASINYRTGYGKTLDKSTEGKKTLARALDDAQDAYAFLIKNPEKYHIDTTQIWLGGSSSGAILSLHLGLMSESQLKNNFQVEKKIKNVKTIISLCGALSDTIPMENAPEINLITIHGSQDQFVPFVSGSPSPPPFLGLQDIPSDILYGSAVIKKKSLEVNRKHDHFTFQGKGHIPYDASMPLNKYKESYNQSIHFILSHLPVNYKKNHYLPFNYFILSNGRIRINILDTSSPKPNLYLKHENGRNKEIKLEKKGIFYFSKKEIPERSSLTLQIEGKEFTINL